MPKRRGNLIIVSAPSGGGKTSLTRAALQQLNAEAHTAAISVSFTTRAARPGEQDGVHYHFVDQKQFEQMVGDNAFLEHAQVFGNFYGTGADHTERLLASGTDVIFDIDWQGAQQIKRKIPHAVGIFILPPSRAELEKRLNSRGQDSQSVIDARMAQAQSEMQHYGEYDYLLVNEVFEQALGELTGIILSLRKRTGPMTRQHAALIKELLGLDSDPSLD